MKEIIKADKMIKIQINVNVGDSIDKISINDLINWRNQVISYFDSKNIFEIELLMQKKHFDMIERQRTIKCFNNREVTNILKDFDFMKYPDYVFGMKVLVLNNNENNCYLISEKHIIKIER